MRISVTFDEGTPDTFRGKVAGFLARLPRHVCLDGNTLSIEIERSGAADVLADMCRAFSRADRVRR